MDAPEANSTRTKPLTKRTAKGILYVRRADAELQIEKTLTLEKPQILAMLGERERRDEANYLLDETIVYLLREPEDAGNFREILYSELNRRIWKLLKKFYKNFNDAADFEDFGQKIEMAILKKIFDTNSDSADYAQVNFGDFVVKTAKVVWRGELVKIDREKEIFYVERVDEEDNGNQLENRAVGDAPTDYTMMLKEGLAKLPPHIMIVAELLLDGWQIESKDVSEPTISKKLDVSSRTIRNWLKEARVILSDYNAEVRK